MKNNWKRLLVTVLRISIGWHFFYEGLSKLLASDWSAYSYLVNSTSFISGFYKWLASSQAILNVVDILNVYGIILMGLGLMFGILVRCASISGILLLLLYYFAYPPFGISLMMQSEANLYIVNMILLEAGILGLFLFLRDTGYGMRYFMKFCKSLPDKAEGQEVSEDNSRREMLKNISVLPLIGVLGWGALNNRSKYDIDVMSSATIQVNKLDLNELKGELPMGKIGNHEISRLVLGGNLILGAAHARDLIYVHQLLKSYNTEKKIYETFMLAEQAGINSINIGFKTSPVLEKYKKITGSKIKVISHVSPSDSQGAGHSDSDLKNKEYYTQINQAIDYGADILQIHGGSCDKLVRDNRIDVIDKMMDKIRSQGYTVGLAAHALDALIACEDQGIMPDYYMKTMHHDRYWSAHPRENRVPFEVGSARNLDHNKFHDNIFCLFPDRTVEFVNRAKVPVMGFKVLAAGAIKPEDGFNWAFKNGADFICVGIFDFQMVKDVNITIDVLNNLKGRKREWYG